MVINDYVEELPANAGSTAALVARNAMANNSDSGLLLDIQMEQISR